MIKGLKKSKGKKYAFTLSEAVVTITIISVIAAVALPNFFIQSLKVKNGEAEAVLWQLWSAQREYLRENAPFYADAPWRLDVTAGTSSGNLEEAMKYFKDLEINVQSNVTCGATTKDILVRVTEEENRYDLNISRGGEIFCTPCDFGPAGKLCRKMGYNDGFVPGGGGGAEKQKDKQKL